jgi:hypothetical protein
VAYYDHIHSGLYETNILKVLKQAEGETCLSLCSWLDLEGFGLSKITLRPQRKARAIGRFMYISLDVIRQLKKKGMALFNTVMNLKEVILSSLT